MAIEGCTKFEVGDVNMNIIEVNEGTQDLIQQLLMVWEKSVRETHLFLLDAEIENIKQYVPEALSGVAHLIIANIVAMEDEIIVGFGDIDKSGYLDRLYVHKDYQRNGIASALCEKLEQSVTDNKIVTHASITAKPFFEQRGYCIVKKQEVMRCGIALTNYVMEK